MDGRHARVQNPDDLTSESLISISGWDTMESRRLPISACDGARCLRLHAWNWNGMGKSVCSRRRPVPGLFLTRQFLDLANADTPQPQQRSELDVPSLY
jgi:hypothetical protein